MLKIANRTLHSILSKKSVALILLSLSACTGVHLPTLSAQQPLSSTPRHMQQSTVFTAKPLDADNIASIPGAKILAYQSGQSPLVKTTPFEAMVISLEPGEHFIQVTCGDPRRWSYTVTTSGKGAFTQQHILVKPALPDIHTNLIITTDRRLYTLRLHSTSANEATHHLQFTYPETATLGRDNTQEGLLALSGHNLHFNYTVSHSWWECTPIWKPLRVFDDEQHTYIELPEAANHQDLPALLVLDEHQQPLLVNYRYHAPYLIVDTLFHRAMLVKDVGHQQTKILLTHRE